MAGEKKTVPRWSSQLASERRAYIPWKKYESGRFLKYVAERKIAQKELDSIRCAAQKQKCEKNVAMDVFSETASEAAAG